MSASTDVTVIGAGPYGLSIGAHLATIPGLDFRIIGRPMQNWMSRMPKGMHLKSAAFASNLSDMQRQFTLRRFYEDHGIAYHDYNLPVPLETFSAYGLAFQKRFLPHLTDDHLVAMERCGPGFRLLTADGEEFISRRVILAVGLADFSFIPRVLAHLPREALTHSSEHHSLDQFQGRDVVVVGGGSAAVDIAVLLHEAQARVQQVVRRDLHFGGVWRDSSATWWSRLCTPLSGIGPGWRNRLYADFPNCYPHLPERLRLRIIKRHLGPSGGWFMAGRAAAVPLLCRHAVEEASLSGGRVKLRLRGDAGCRDIITDHVIAATGYKVDLGRLAFLGAGIRKDLQLSGNYPRLRSNLESSVEGLHFVGPLTAGSFGPLMRFVAGTDFTANRLAANFLRPRHLGGYIRIPRLQG